MKKILSINRVILWLTLLHEWNKMYLEWIIVDKYVNK